MKPTGMLELTLEALGPDRPGLELEASYFPNLILNFVTCKWGGGCNNNLQRLKDRNPEWKCSDQLDT